MILLSYDGSDHAQAAIDTVARTMPGAQVTVLTVWEPWAQMLMRTSSMAMGMGAGMIGSYGDGAEIDDANKTGALAKAAEGAERATAAGLSATPMASCSTGDVAHTILAVGAELDADLIVLGTRGLSGVKSFLVGSVSHAVIQHADRAVLVVPSPELAQRRHGDRDTGPAIA